MTFIEDLARGRLEGLEQVRRDFGRRPRQEDRHGSVRRRRPRKPPVSGTG